MKKRFAGFNLILLTALLFSSDMLYGQTNIAISDFKINTEVTQVTKPYSMRLDFMTESKMDEIIQSSTVSLDDLCGYTMGCKSRKDIILNKGDRIQLFTDPRIENVQLIKIESDKKTSIATSVTNNKESYIVVTQKITRENIASYMLFVQK